jgi:hypothetical protein
VVGVATGGITLAKQVSTARSNAQAASSRLAKVLEVNCASTPSPAPANAR